MLSEEEEYVKMKKLENKQEIKKVPKKNAIVCLAIIFVSILLIIIGLLFKNC